MISQPSMLSVLDDSLNPIGLLDAYTSLTLIQRFYGVGSFDVSIPDHENRYQYIEKDQIIDFGHGGMAAGIIEGVERPFTHLGQTLRLFGPTLDGLMKRRIIVPSDDPSLLGWDVASGTAGSIMAHYVNDHAINPLQPTRKIPYLYLQEGIEQIGLETVAKGRFDVLADLLQEVGQYASVGWRIILTGNGMEFQALPTVDRSSSSDNPLILSTTFQNVSSGSYSVDATDYANAVYALGAGEYENRLVQVYYPNDETISGWFRRETVADCANEESVLHLKEIALQKIAELEQTDTLMLELIPGAADVHLGDMVTVSLPAVGAVFDLVITETNQTWQSANTTQNITLGRPPRTLTTQLNRVKRLRGVT